MKSNNKSILVFTTIVCLLPILLALLLYAQLPGQIPVHFDSLGMADRYWPKAFACFGLPVGFAGLNLVVHFFTNADPKSAYSSDAMKLLGKWLVPVIAIIVVPLSLFIALGKDIPIQIIIPCLVGIVIIVCGNYLPKSRQNYTIGIKLPWTLNSEENWNRTHRLAGKLWILGGFLMLLFSLIQFHPFPVLLALMVCLVVIPMIYSYLLHKKGI